MMWWPRIGRRPDRRPGVVRFLAYSWAALAWLALHARALNIPAELTAPDAPTSSGGLILLENDQLQQSVKQGDRGIDFPDDINKNSESYNNFRSYTNVRSNLVVNKNKFTISDDLNSDVSNRKSIDVRQGKILTWGDYISKSSEVPYTTAREISWGSSPRGSTLNTVTVTNSPQIRNLNIYSKNKDFSRNGAQTVPLYNEATQSSNINLYGTATERQEMNSPITSKHVLDQLTHYLLHGNDEVLEKLSQTENKENNDVQKQTAKYSQRNYQSQYEENLLPIKPNNYNNQLVKKPMLPALRTRPINYDKGNNFAHVPGIANLTNSYIHNESDSSDDIHHIKHILNDLSTLMEIFPEITKNKQTSDVLGDMNNSVHNLITYGGDTKFHAQRDNSASKYFQTPVIQESSKSGTPSAYNFQPETIQPVSAIKITQQKPSIRKAAQTTLVTTENSFDPTIFTSKPIFSRDSTLDNRFIADSESKANFLQTKIKQQGEKPYHLVVSSPISASVSPFVHSINNLSNTNDKNDYDESFFANPDYEYVDTENPSWNASTQLFTNENENETTQKAQRRTLDLLYHMFVDPTTDENGNRRNTLFEDVIKAIDGHIIGDIKALREHTQSGQKGQSHFKENNSDFFKTLVESIGLDRNFMKSTADAFSELGSTPSKGSLPVSSTRISNDPNKRQTEIVNSIIHSNPTANAPQVKQMNLNAGHSIFAPSAQTRETQKVEPLPSGDEFVVTDSDGSKLIVSINDIISSLASLNEEEMKQILTGSESTIRRSDQDVVDQFETTEQSFINDNGEHDIKINNLIVLGNNGKSESIPFENLSGNSANTQKSRRPPVVLATQHLLEDSLTNEKSMRVSVTASPTVQAAQVLLGLQPTLSSPQNSKSNYGLLPTDDVPVTFSSDRNHPSHQQLKSHSFHQIPGQLSEKEQEIIKLIQEDNKLLEVRQQILNEQQRIYQKERPQLLNSQGKQIHAIEQQQDVPRVSETDDALEQVFQTILKHQQEQIKYEQAVRDQIDQPVSNHNIQSIHNRQLQQQLSQIQDLEKQIRETKVENENLLKLKNFDEMQYSDILNKNTDDGNQFFLSSVKQESSPVGYHFPPKEPLPLSSVQKDTENTYDSYLNLNSKLPLLRNSPSSDGSLHHKNADTSSRQSTLPTVNFHTPPDLSTSQESYQVAPIDSSNYFHSLGSQRETSQIRPYDSEVFRRQVMQKQLDDGRNQNFASTMYDHVMNSLPKPIHFKKTPTTPPPERPTIFGFNIPNIFPTEHGHDEEAPKEDSSMEQLKYNDPLGLMTIYNYLPFSRRTSNDVKSKPSTPKPVSPEERFEEALKQGNVPSHVSKILVDQMKQKSIDMSSSSKIPELIRRHSTGYSPSRTFASRQEPTYYSQPIAHRRSSNIELKSHHKVHHLPSEHSVYSHPSESIQQSGFGTPGPTTVLSESYKTPSQTQHYVSHGETHSGATYGGSDEYDSYIVPLGYKGPPPKDQPIFDISLLFNSVRVAKTGDDNESISLPKIGDPRKFVNVYRPPHY